MNSRLSVFFNFLLKNNKLRSFLFFFLVSLLLWLLSQLSKNYYYTLKVPVIYYNFPADTYSDIAHVDTLKVRIKASGYQIIGLRIKKNVLKFDVKKHDLIRKKIWYPKTLKNQIQYEVTGFSNTILNISPDTIYFKENDWNKKKLPIRPQFDITYKPGYKNTEKYTLLPAFVWVFGSQENLDTLRFINTKNYHFDKVSVDVDRDLELLIPSDLKSNIKKTHFHLPVDQFLEDTLTLPVQIINFPKNQKIIIFPDKALVKYKLFSKDYKRLSPDDFKLVVDYNKKIKTEDEWRLVPQLIKYPDVIFDYQISPKNIAFLIKK